MTREELQYLFAIRGFRARIKSDEVQVEVCTFCGNDRYNLELNPAAGVYHCWTCGARGRLENYLKNQFSLNYAIPVNLAAVTGAARRAMPEGGVTKDLTDPWARQYLASRGIDSVDCNIYEIYQGKGDSWDGRVVFTLRDYWNHKVAGFNGRAVLAGLKPKYFAHWMDGTKSITGYRSHSRIHVLVEGIFDCLRVHRSGFNAAMLGGVNETQVESWAARVPEGHTVCVLLDGDAADQGRKLYWRIYPIHPEVVFIPLPPEFDPALIEPAVLHALITERTTRC